MKLILKISCPCGENSLYRVFWQTPVNGFYNNISILFQQCSIIKISLRVNVLVFVKIVLYVINSKLNFVKIYFAERFCRYRCH